MNGHWCMPIVWGLTGQWDIYATHTHTNCMIYMPMLPHNTYYYCLFISRMFRCKHEIQKSPYKTVANRISFSVFENLLLLWILKWIARYSISWLSWQFYLIWCAAGGAYVSRFFVTIHNIVIIAVAHNSYMYIIDREQDTRIHTYKYVLAWCQTQSAYRSFIYLFFSSSYNLILYIVVAHCHTTQRQTDSRANVLDSRIAFIVHTHFAL